MRSAGNFSPEWGYLAPAPSFLRTARVVLVATAVGATAGAAVVLSLVDRPAAEANNAPIAARAIVTSVHASPVATVAPSAQPSVAAAVAVPSNVVASPDAKPPLDVKANAVLPAQPQLPAQAAPQMRAEAPAQPQPPMAVQPVATINAPAESVAVTPAAAAPVPPPAAGIAALSPAPVVAPETATSDAPDLTIAAPEPALPQKKAKHAATKPKTEPGLGSVLKHLFSAAASKQSVH